MVRLKFFAAGLDIAAGQFVLVGECDGVDHEIELAPLRFDFGEHGVDGVEIGDVAMTDDNGAQFGRQRLDALLSALRPDR